MSYEETLKTWEKIFILVMEECDDSVYKKAEEIINKEANQKALKGIIEDEIPLPWAIGFYIVIMILESVGPDKLSELDDKEIIGRINDFWVRYLKKPTKAFTTKYGLPPINSESLNVGLKIYKK